MSINPGQSISPVASITCPAVCVGRCGSIAEIRPSATPTSVWSAGPTPMKTWAPLIRRSNDTDSPPTRSVYFFCHGKSLSPDRTLRIPGRPVRRDARDHGHPFPERGHTPGRRRPGSAGLPEPRGRHTVRHPRGCYREPDRLLGRPQSGAIVRAEVGAVCKAHPRAPGAGRRALRTPRRQGCLRGSFLLGLPRARSARGRREPHALGHFPVLQRPRRGGVGHGGRSWGGVFLGEVGVGGGVGGGGPPPGGFF